MSFDQEILKAAEIIKNGGVVAFPTETVYGLGADATNDEACKKIYQLKGRPANNPLIIHVETIGQAEELGVFNPLSYKLAELWPGPITLVMKLQKLDKISPIILGRLDTVAIRIPKHKIARKLLNLAGCPIAAPSANLSNYISATTAKHVLDDFDNKVYILNDFDEKCEGLESTIIDVTGTQPIILRSGKITLLQIEQLLQKKILYAHKEAMIKAPGMMIKHYSPQTSLRLNAAALRENEIGLNYYNSNLGGEFNLSKKGDLNEAASNLYDMLRIIDKLAQRQNIKSIAVSKIPFKGLGIAINDRLHRAAEK